MSLQMISKIKNSEILDVPFDPPFVDTPTVIASSYWKNQSTAVNDVETVTNISNTGCTIVSGNNADNYYVNLAIIDSGSIQFGGGQIQSGAKLKTKPTVPINFTPHMPVNDPVTLLTSFWNGSNSGVANQDTLDNLSASECSVISGNEASNYYSSYLSTSPGIYIENGQVLMSGIANKQANGRLRIYFPTSFNETPTVVVSPWWDDANSQVGTIETIDTINNEYFEVVSGNYNTDYYVHWLAMGK